MHKGLVGLCLDALILKLLLRMPSVLFALATTVSMCWLNLVLCCSVMPRYFVEVMTYVLRHLVVELILVTTGSLFAAHGQDTALAMLHVPLLFPLFHLLDFWRSACSLPCIID